MKSFDGTPIATIRNTQTGIPFTMRLVRQGDGYGRGLGITHDKADPLVEFYDARYACEQTQERGAEYGQFVSRYYLSTLLRDGPNTRLVLDGGVDAWTLDAVAYWTARVMLAHWTA